MVNKKGYMRTIEAIIALVIILSVVFFTLPRNASDESSVPNIVKASQDAIIKQILLDNEIKDCVVKSIDDSCQADASLKIGDIIEENQPKGYDYAFMLCDNPICICSVTDTDCKKASGKSPSEINSNVYMTDLFISSTVQDAINQEDKHRILRFWMWNNN